MKLLMISTDRNIFNEGSSVSKRMVEMSKDFDVVFIIVFSLMKQGLQYIKLSDKVYVYPTNSLFRLAHIARAVILGKKLLKENTFKDKDLVTCQDPFETGVVGYLLKRLYKTRLELQLHTDLYSSYFTRHSVLNKIRRIIAKNILPHADQIRVVSRKIADSLINRGLDKSKIFIKPVSVDLDKFKTGSPKFSLREKYPNFKTIILIVSRLEKEKNLENALSAILILSKTINDMGLVIVGDGRETKSLVKLASLLKIEPYVAFEGWQDDLLSYYLGCDVVLLTSWYEGYGVVLKEAEICKRRIVSTDVGIAREVGARIVGWRSEEIAAGLLNQLK